MSATVAVAEGVVALLVLWLLRQAWRLERRLTRVEALLERNGLARRRNG
jgi:hypothetical protein